MMNKAFLSVSIILKSLVNKLFLVDDGRGDCVGWRYDMRPQLWHQVPYQLHHHLRVPTGRGVRWKLQERDGHRLDFLVSDWSIQNLNMTEKYVVVLCQSIESHEIPEILFPCLIQEGLCNRLWAKGVQWVCRDLQHSIGERLQYSRTRGESRMKCQFPLS